jgi:hypothetical protein
VHEAAALRQCGLGVSLRAMTTAPSESYPIVSKVIDLFGDWLKQRRKLKELMEYEADPGELEWIAREFGVTPADLDMLVRQGSHSADELPKMLKALGIDEADVWWAEPALLRDMERVCSFCERKRQCRHELAVGTARAKMGNTAECGCNRRAEVQELRSRSSIEAMSAQRARWAQTRV